MFAFIHTPICTDKSIELLTHERCSRISFSISFYLKSDRAVSLYLHLFVGILKRVVKDITRSAFKIKKIR